MDLNALRGFCRIDYQVATPGIAGKAVRASIWKDTRFGDHAPLTVSDLNG